MNLRECASSSLVLDELPLELCQSRKTVKVLGIKWSLSKDTLAVSFPSFADLPLLTKRIVLSAVSDMFDPKGLFLPGLSLSKSSSGNCGL